jgi:hypothetical protein
MAQSRKEFSIKKIQNLISLHSEYETFVNTFDRMLDAWTELVSEKDYNSAKRIAKKLARFYQKNNYYIKEAEKALESVGRVANASDLYSELRAENSPDSLDALTEKLFELFFQLLGSKIDKESSTLFENEHPSEVHMSSYIYGYPETTDMMFA